MKHFSIIAVMLVFLVGTSLMAAEVNTLAAAKARVESDKVIVPLELKNVQSMMALDLPLQYSKGATLEQVVFEGTRAESFDFAYANIDQANNRVIIGLIPMVYGENKDLEPGSGEIARLVFSVESGVEAIELTPVETSNPDHSLMYIYAGENGETLEMTPELSGLTVALSSSEVGGNLPTQFALFQNAPNPFNPTTMLAYDLPQPTHVKLEIFNVLGQKVKTLVDNFQEAGSQNVIWDGTDLSGASVASGIYFYRISAGSFNATKKMMMLK